MNSYCFIYNPAANPDASPNRFGRLKELAGEWEQARFLTSRKKGDIEALAREWSPECDVVVACGGDGTAREVATGVMRSGVDTAMAVIPMGSGNDFAKSLQMPRSLADGLRIIRNGSTRKIDIGRCNDTYFVNSFGIGFDGLANYHSRHTKLKGNLRYIWGALQANWQQEPLRATISQGDRTYSETLIMITLANGRVEGGKFIVAPDARLDDGLLDVVTVRPVSKWILPFLLPLLLVGWQRWIRQFKLFRASELRIRLDQPAYIHADGDIVKPDETEFVAEVLPSALRVIGNFTS